MRILILGAGGMAGHLAVVYLKEKGHEITAFTKTPITYCENMIGDALDNTRLKKVLNDKPFDAVINCIGILNKNVDNNIAEGIYINSYLPHFIAECLQGMKTKFIHLSTDCVFLGEKGNYNEESLPDAYTLYGRTKSLGEIKDNKNLTIRTSIIGPDIKPNGMGLLNWFMGQKEAVKGFTTAIWTGISTFTLAQAFECAVEQDLSGIYHLVNNHTISKYELLQLFNHYLKNEQIEIIPSEAVKVDKSLINNRKDFDFAVPSYEQMVKEISVWITTHKEFYPHYF